MSFACSAILLLILNASLDPNISRINKRALLFCLLPWMLPVSYSETKEALVAWRWPGWPCSTANLNLWPWSWLSVDVVTLFSEAKEAQGFNDTRYDNASKLIIRKSSISPLYVPVCSLSRKGVSWANVCIYSNNFWLYPTWFLPSPLRFALLFLGVCFIPHDKHHNPYCWFSSLNDSVIFIIDFNA